MNQRFREPRLAAVGRYVALYIGQNT